MLKTFKHPLFKRELAQIKWSTLLMILALLLPLLLVLNEIDHNAQIHGFRIETMDFLTEVPSDILGWLVIPILIISQFYYTRKDSVSGLLASLPYSRKKQILFKYFSGIISICSSYFVVFLVMSSTYFSAGHPLDGPYSPIFVWLLITSASSIFQYSFLFLIATLMGNSVFAGVAGFLIYYTPAFLVGSILLNVDMFFDYYVDLEPLFKIVFPHYISYTAHWYNQSSVLITDVLPILLGYTIGSTLLFKLAEKAFNLNNYEYNGNMFMFIWAENVFLAGFSLCFGFLALDFSQAFQSGWLYPLAIVIGLACFPVGYILARKLLQITGHQLQFKRS